MRTRTFAAALILLAQPASAQEAKPGPIIETAGAVFTIPDPDLPTPPDREYKVAFEMAAAAPSPDQMNVTLNSAARFLNMHAQAGVPAEHVGAAIVVHGPAGWELLDTEAYQARNGVPNPNAALLDELMAAGVRVILCGQTAASRGIPREGLQDGVEVALSAMTAFLLLQDEGFRPNPW